jgi:subtilisin-like proprotein convertase family protein
VKRSPIAGFSTCGFTNFLDNVNLLGSYLSYSVTQGEFCQQSISVSPCLEHGRLNALKLALRRPAVSEADGILNAQLIP